MDRKLKWALYLIFSIILLQCSLASRGDDFVNSSISLQKLIDSLKIKKSDLSIFIDKSDYKLTVFAGKKILKEYPVVLGGNPIDDKLRQGDKCTPEGTFKVRGYYPHKKWSKFIWIDLS